jgi:hypothetical protein
LDYITNKDVSTGTGNRTNYNIFADQVNITNTNIFSDKEDRDSRYSGSETDYNDIPERTKYSSNAGQERGRIYHPGSETNFNATPVRTKFNEPAQTGITTPVRNKYSLNSEWQQNSTPTNMGLQQNTLYYDDEPRQEKMVLAVKTNMLFNAITALNLELEAPLGNRWSLAGEYTFPWWLSENRQFCFQMISGLVELRRWTGYRENRSQMTGWFSGFFVGGGYFDFQKGVTGYQGETSLAIGLSGGYAHEISKDGKWRMEYSLGLGYLNTNYREYKQKVGLDDAWHLIRQKTGHNTYIGPVRAKISLVRTLNIYK